MWEHLSPEGAALRVVLGLGPAVLAAALLTASLYGSPIGIPLLALFAPPWVAALRRRTAPTELPTYLKVWALLAVATYTALFGVVLAIAADDFDNAVEALGFVLVALALALAWSGVLGLTRHVADGAT